MTKFIQQLMTALQNAVNGLIDLLPLSPFTFTVEAEFRTIMGYINYFIPIDGMIKILQAWLVCILAWYAAIVILRWIKAIE